VTEQSVAPEPRAARVLKSMSFSAARWTVALGGFNTQCMSIVPSLDEFRRSLAATIAWCGDGTYTPNRSEHLRSAQLRPPIDIANNTDSLDVVRGAVQCVIDRRCTYLGLDRDANISVDLAGGRLLAFYPQVTIFDGWAAIESNGFFDPANVPPWDTWIFFIDDFLISFVPQRFINNVESGLITNAEECILWLREVSHSFVLELKNLKLVE
jgi:hypothetical protein